MEFDIKGEKQRVDYDAAATLSGYRVFTCAVRAHQMADPITATFHYGDGQTVTKVWSIRQYLAKFSNDGSSTGNLVAATMNYGHYVQPYMNEVHHWTFGENQEHEVMPGASEISALDNASDFAHKWIQPRDYTIMQSAQYFLTLNASTTLNIQVQLKDAPTSVSASVDGNSWNAEKIDNNTYMIAIPNIASNNLGKPYRVLLTVDGNVVFELNVSALSYVNTVLHSDRASSTERLALTALYHYYQAAIAYKPN